MKILDFPQGSQEWLEARAGKVTASCVASVMAKIKTGEAADRRNYKYQIVSEILTGKPQGPTYISQAMQDGIDNEKFARAAYEMKKNLLIEQVGLVIHEKNERLAASPDGLVGKDGLIEIKCPLPATHISYLMAKTIPGDYQKQMQTQMLCCERVWNDFVSFCPSLPENLQLVIIRLIRDETAIKEIETETEKFLSEVDEIVKELRGVKNA